MLLHRTGMRIGEARALWWSDIDWNERFILVRRNLPSGRKPQDLTTTKTGERKVDMSPQLVRVLKRLRVKRKRQWLGKGKGATKWVFCLSTGNPLATQDYRVKFERIQGKLKIRYRTPHQLRHTFASALLSAGEPFMWAAAQMGDKPQSVLDTYAHWIPTEPVKDEDTRRGVERLDERTDAFESGRETHTSEG